MDSICLPKWSHKITPINTCWILFLSYVFIVLCLMCFLASIHGCPILGYRSSNNKFWQSKKPEIGMSRWTWIRQSFGICQQHSEGCHGQKTDKKHLSAFAPCYEPCLWHAWRGTSFFSSSFMAPECWFLFKKKLQKPNGSTIQLLNYFSQSW